MNGELDKHSSIQTNAYALTDEHFELFAKYKTSVGVSIDGPWPLNRYRGFGSREQRQAQTAQVMENIRRLRELGISVSVISVITHLHIESPDLYWSWVLDLRDMGIVSGRMNYVQRIEGFDNAHASEDDFAAFYVQMAERHYQYPDLQWQPFRDVVDNLLGLGLGTCVFTKCDPYSTSSAFVVDGQGETHSCLRTGQDGKCYLRAPTGEMRYECLRQTPQEYGGCKGCRWWKVCFGSCPSVSINGDWRNRGDYCAVWKALYEYVERRLKGLMPNLHLVTEDEPEEYEERKQGIGERTFAAMIRRGGSSWRASARCGSKPSQKPNQKPGTWEKVSYSDAHGYLVDLGNGYKHADHSDTGRTG